MIEKIRQRIAAVAKEACGYAPLTRVISEAEVEEILEQEEKTGGWIPVSERLPDVDEYILVSFENFTTPMIGRYTVDDDDSGTFRVGDEDESFVEDGLFVNAWMPLPKPYRESEE